MPLIDSNLQATWDSLYSCEDNLSGTRHYTRDVRWQYIGRDPEGLLAALVSKGFQPGVQRIALIGAGFGWVAERLVELGCGPMADGTANGKICNVETSAWIQANKAQNAVTTIINADINGATGRRTVRQQFGSNNAEVHWVVSEDMISLLTGAGPTPGGNNEIQPFCDACRQIASVGVAHWTSVGVRRFDDPNTWAGDPRLNWKTLEEWKAWCSPDWVIGRNENNRVL